MKTFTQSDMVLLKGEVSIWNKERQSMLYTTDPFYINLGIKQLDRDKFVKPVDVEEIEALASKAFPYDDNIDLCELNDCRRGFIEGFTHNANKKEFTREEMIRAMNASAFFVFKHNIYQFDEYTRGYLDGIRPLSIPKSITVDQYFNVLNVIWK